MTTQISGACAGSTIIDVLHSRATHTGQCTHRVEEGRETLPFGFCVRKKKESLECFSLEDWRIARYTRRGRKACHSSRSINLDAWKRDIEGHLAPPSPPPIYRLSKFRTSVVRRLRRAPIAPPRHRSLASFPRYLSPIIKIA